MRVAMEELVGNDPGEETSGYVVGQSEHVRRDELKTAGTRGLLLTLPGRLEVGPPLVIETEGGVGYVGGGQYSMLRSWRDRVMSFLEVLFENKWFKITCYFRTAALLSSRMLSRAGGGT